MGKSSVLHACEQLEQVLLLAENQHGTLLELIHILEFDLEQTNEGLDLEGESVIEPSIHLFVGCLQQQTSTISDYKVRLQQLIAELQHQPQSVLARSLMHPFGRLFASIKDTDWIEQQDQPERHTERLVPGLLPSQTTRFLRGEGQLMLGKFTKSCTSWLQMFHRLNGHKYWIDEMFATLPPGHPFSQPLLILGQAMVKHCNNAESQVSIRRSIERLNEIQQEFGGDLGPGRVFSLEILQLQSMVREFPQPLEEGEE